MISVSKKFPKLPKSFQSKVLFINRKDNRNCKTKAKLLQNLLQNYK